MKKTGNLIIKWKHKVFLDDKELHNDDTITIKVKQLKQIMKDAEANVI